MPNDDKKKAEAAKKKPKGYKVKRKKPYSQSGPATKAATGTTTMAVRKPNKAAGRTIVRKTTKSAYGGTPRNKSAAVTGKIAPNRKALYSEQYPDRKTQDTSKETMVSNPTWRKAALSVKSPSRAIKGKDVRKAAKNLIKKKK